jgi:hypothetical protein
MMLGDFSNVDARASRVSKGSILRPLRRGRAVPGLQRRLRASEEVPAAGQIVLRSATQILR